VERLTASDMPEITPSQIIGQALRLYRDQVVTLIGAALLVYAVELALALIFVSPLVGLVSFVLAIFYQGMVVQLVRDVQDGRRDSSMGDLFRSVGPVLLPLIVVAIIFGIGVGIGLVLLIVPGLILLTIWAVVAPVTVIERPGIFAAFGRSTALVRGHGWAVFGVIVLVFLLNIAIGIVAALIGAPLGDTGRSVVGWIASALTAPIIALTASVLYFSLVAREPAGPQAFPEGAQPSA
jgi:hypothetical protein